MIKRKTEKVNKCIVFAGCSFTWGQGLYFHSGLPSLVEQPWNTYDHSLVNHTQIEQAARLRFPRLVADHFGTAEIVDRVNGGTHQSILKWWNTCFFSDTNFVENHGRTDIPLEDVGLVVMQLTQPHRCSIPFEGPGIPFNELANKKSMLKRFAKKYKLKSFQEYQDWYINYSLTPVQEFLKRIESHGVPTLVLTWPQENVQWIESQPWMRDRYMKIRYKDVEYPSMMRMMGDDREPWKGNNPELTLGKDYENFEIPPKDDHPSKLCHEVMAENIIREIKERNLL